MEKETSKDKEIEVIREEEKDDSESPKGKARMLEWLEKQLEKRAPAPTDPTSRLEA